MASVNVNRNVTDPFYRYKMPRILAKVEGKGNGIKTVIVNMVDVAKALHRPAEYPTKYFGCELGAQTQFDVKNERYIVNGSHDAFKLQDLLDDFIKRFVLCQECDNPETNLIVKKGFILQRCIACGHTGNIDMCHKLTTYILKCPPPAEDNHGTNNTPNKKTAPKSKKDKTKKGKESNGTPQTNGDHGENGVEEKVADKESGEDDLDWNQDVSEEAVKARMQALSSAARNLTIDEDLGKSERERIDIFYNYLMNKKKDSFADASDKAVLAEAERLDIKDKAPMIMVEIFFDANIITQLKTFRNYFIRFTHDNKKAQKNVIGGLEILIGKVYHEALINKVPHIFKWFYDNDILFEEVLIEWHSKQASKKFISKEEAAEIKIKAQPFITWLQEAEEEESSEGEDDDDDLEIVYDERATSVAIETVKKPEVSNNKVEEDDDFDIDAI